MTLAEANAVLDAAREGADVPTWLISSALYVTGDLCPVRHAFTWNQPNDARSPDVEPSLA